MRYATKRYYDWTANIGYAVGLMASDGCLISDGRHLDLTSVDIDQLENFSQAMGRNLKITSKFNLNKQPAYRIQFSDVAFYDFLLAAGLTPNKSLTIEQVNVPDIYYADFLRGLFDGDGSTYAYNDPRWPNSFLYYICFTSGSRKFIEHISAKNQRLIGVAGSSIRKSPRAFTLAYGKKDSLLLYKFMYYEPTVISLGRKRLKLESFIKKDSMLK